MEAAERWLGLYVEQPDSPHEKQKHVETGGRASSLWLELPPNDLQCLRWFGDPIDLLVLLLLCPSLRPPGESGICEDVRRQQVALTPSTLAFFILHCLEEVGEVFLTKTFSFLESRGAPPLRPLQDFHTWGSYLAEPLFPKPV